MHNFYRSWKFTVEWEDDVKAFECDILQQRAARTKPWRWLTFQMISFIRFTPLFPQLKVWETLLRWISAHVDGCLVEKRQIPCLGMLINEHLAKPVILVDANHGKNCTRHDNVNLKQQQMEWVINPSWIRLAYCSLNANRKQLDTTTHHIFGTNHCFGYFGMAPLFPQVDNSIAIWGYFNGVFIVPSSEVLLSSDALQTESFKRSAHKVPVCRRQTEAKRKHNNSMHKHTSIKKIKKRSKAITLQSQSRPTWKYVSCKSKNELDTNEVRRKLGEARKKLEGWRRPLNKGKWQDNEVLKSKNALEPQQRNRHFPFGNRLLSRRKWPRNKAAVGASCLECGSKETKESYSR